VSGTTYNVEVFDRTTGWRAVSSGHFVVGPGLLSYPSDTDALEAAVNYADSIKGVGQEVRVVRTSIEIVYGDDAEVNR